MNDFIEVSRRFLRTDFYPRLEAAVKDLREEDIWWRPNDASNSIGNLILHLCGNMRQWIVEGLGGIPTHRDRDGEFAARGPMPKAMLLSRLEQALAEVDGVLQSFDAARLTERKTIQIYDVSALHAIYHVVEHFSYHLGQILYIVKLRTGHDLKFYENLESK